jgi:hypothetical protein
MTKSAASRVVSVFLLLTTVACTPPARDVNYGIQGVILSAGRVRSIEAWRAANRDGAPDPNEPYWTPSRSDVESFTQQFIEFLKRTSHPIDKAIRRNLHEYMAQYYGVTEDGRQALVLAAFCLPESERSNPTVDWSEKLYWTAHDGRCFFYATYEPASKKLAAYYVSPYPGRGPITVFDPIPMRYPAHEGSGVFDSAERTVNIVGDWGEWIGIGMERDPMCAISGGPFFRWREVLERCPTPPSQPTDGWDNEMLFWIQDGHHVVISFGSDGAPDHDYRAMGDLVSEIKGAGALQDPRNDIIVTDGEFVSWPDGVVLPEAN